MTTADANRLADTVDALQETALTALGKESPEQFEFVEQQINRLEATIREIQQEMWGAEVRTAIDHLEEGKALTNQDLAVIRAFLVSDAEAYMAHENNYEDWVQELSRLLKDMRQRAANVSRETISDLRGVLKDAIRLVPDIRNYLEEKRRIRQFDAALKSLDRPSRQMMAGILQEQISSPRN
jgi:signal transduction histidine kinase